jgi:hypothetical protein
MRKKWTARDILLFGFAVCVFILTAGISWRYSEGVKSFDDVRGANVFEGRPGAYYKNNSSGREGDNVIDNGGEVSGADGVLEGDDSKSGRKGDSAGGSRYNRLGEGQKAFGEKQTVEEFASLKPLTYPQHSLLPIKDLRNAVKHDGTCYKREGYTTASVGDCSDLTLKAIVNVSQLYDPEYIEERMKKLENVRCGEPGFDDNHEECWPTIVTYATQCSTPLNMYVEMAHRAGLGFKLLWLDSWGGFGHR